MNEKKLNAKLIIGIVIVAIFTTFGDNIGEKLFGAVEARTELPVKNKELIQELKDKQDINFLIGASKREQLKHYVDSTQMQNSHEIKMTVKDIQSDVKEIKTILKYSSNNLNITAR